MDARGETMVTTGDHRAPYTDPLTVMSMDHPLEPNVPVEITILMDGISLNDYSTTKIVNRNTTSRIIIKYPIPLV